MSELPTKDHNRRNLIIKLQMPKFNSEQEEADWWFKHQNEINNALVEAAKEKRKLQRDAKKNSCRLAKNLLPAVYYRYGKGYEKNRRSEESRRSSQCWCCQTDGGSRDPDACLHARITGSKRVGREDAALGLYGERIEDVVSD